MSAEKRQPRDNTRLGKELADLENSDPSVRDAAERMDEAFDRLAWLSRTGMLDVQRELWEEDEDEGR
jgi:hypothetical protein